ncbi:hypothetical protein HX017_09355 [Myroides marinus]|jgi:tryptophan-rich sensory protein|uniref:hypothetical protein n=1 Tax=Myroides marinus TaxID=703342 RepID=UPI002577DF47|nr:hypothetical protein [Myroides marinus]MDR0194125.1 hypothetical protein [Myroides sp.]MDM1347187.1 hypothetical protein [Myroides marinus]MDM1350511.1 hypothetical protein [Myroides marinus]MDM1355024.1 hypothetical protein [Myroides marinus]MDM1357754.1 hypothetical protein [Myroides marinus]
MDLDFESKFFMVWIVSSVVIAIFGTLLYKVIQDAKQKKMSTVKYVVAFIVSLVMGLAFEWVLFYLAL